MAERTHLVTGAGSGIGLEVADRLAQRGDRVVRLTRDVVDLSDAVAVARWATDFAEDLEHLDSGRAYGSVHSPLPVKNSRLTVHQMILMSSHSDHCSMY